MPSGSSRSSSSSGTTSSGTTKGRGEEWVRLARDVSLRSRASRLAEDYRSQQDTNVVVRVYGRGNGAYEVEKELTLVDLGELLERVMGWRSW